MHLKNSDIFVVLGIVLLNVVWLLLPYTVLWVSVLLALPLVFFVPGYMLTAVLTHTRRLDVFHHLTFSLGLSLTLDILGGFLLNMLPMGLRTQSWVALLSCLTLIFALALLYFRRGMVYVSGREDRKSVSEHRDQQAPRDRRMHMGRPPEMYAPGMYALEMYPSKMYASETRSIFWTRVRDGIVFALAATLVIVSLVYATQGVAEGQHPGFTQLWILPPSPTTPGCTVNVGIRSFENGSVSYHAAMTIHGTQTMSWPTLVLTPNQQWERSIAIPPTTAKNMFVQVKLYRNDKPTVVYREVHITLNVLMNGQKIVSCGRI